MSASFVLTEDHPEVHGEFWIPGEHKRHLGHLRLESGKKPGLELAEFTGLERWAFIEKIRRDEGHRRGDGHRVIHGIDEHGKPITLIDCYETASRSTRSRLTRKLSCQAAVFGAHLETSELSFKGITLRLDHLDEWLGRSALGRIELESTERAGTKAIKALKVPVAESKSIELKLEGYRRSRISLGWSFGTEHRTHTLRSFSCIELSFDLPRAWNEICEEVSWWKRLFSLATRSNIDVQEISLEQRDQPNEPAPGGLPLLPVWLARSVGASLAHPNLRAGDFHFTFGQVEPMFAEVHARWRAISTSWAAVLHRFVAISSDRDLWINEQFLFLAQAIESMHRARKGLTGSVDFLSAAIQAWDESPAELQALLGDRGAFASTLRKTRNYWTHYGTPGPNDDPEVLDGDELFTFTEKLRWVIEAAILREIGIPGPNIARVWDERWRLHFVNYV